MVVFGQSCCIRAKVVKFGQNWLYLAKYFFLVMWFYSSINDCIRVKEVVFGQSGLVRAKLVEIG